MLSDMFIYGGIVFCILVWGSHGQKPCSTNWSTQGTCISLINCSFLLDLVMQSGPLQATELEALRNSQCGYEGNTPKVCCPHNTQVANMKITSRSEIPDPPNVTKHPNLRLLDNEICGPITESKIIFGNRTMVLEFPWMALIAYNISGWSSPMFACGGSLITKRYILTAAHCVTELGSKTKLSGVRVGEHDFSKEKDCDEDNGLPTICTDKYQDFLIENVYFHNEFVKNEHKNDIALIRINSDADFQPLSVRPICLPIGDYATLKSDKVIVTGWGTTERGIRSQELLKVRLEIAPSDQCARVYQKHNAVNVTYKQICAGGKDRRDSCTGDSGGPLQYPEIINGVPKYVQYGVVSFGSETCGVIGYPGVYTKVVYYMDWILDTITE